MRRLMIALAVLSAAGPALADDTALNALATDYQAYTLSQDPIQAGREGDRKAVARLPDVSIGQDALRRGSYEGLGPLRRAAGRRDGPRKGWTVAQARAGFTDNTALAALNIDVELARYVGWPGQALAYKVGQLKIRELRERAKARLDERFDIRRFHDAVPLCGPLPMDLLEARIDAWIGAESHH